MKAPFRRILRWAFLVAVLALMASAVAFILRNFTGKGRIPSRSSFVGRLPGRPDGEGRRYRFFYATNRVNDEETLNGRGNKLGNGVSTGRFEVRISHYLPIQPFVWLDEKYLEWAGHRESPRDAFLADLRDAVQAAPQKSVLVVVWGYRDWFRSAAVKTAYTAFILDINTPVLLFDWPGNQGDDLRGYAAARGVATQSGPDLGRTLVELVRNTGAERVWLIGSSLGCQTISDAFAWLASQPDPFGGGKKIDHVVFSAPDVSAQAFDDKFAERIQALSRHLTVYVSSNDRALLMSHWLNRGRRLGRTSEVAVPPEDRSGEYEFEEAAELLDLQEKGARNISTVDATPINRTRNLHHFFTDSPEFFDDLYRRLQQPDDDLNRLLYPLRTDRGSDYWILWNDL